MVAAQHGKLEIFRYQADNGANINIRNTVHTALFFTTLWNLVVWILSGYYWMKECLLT